MHYAGLSSDFFVVHGQCTGSTVLHLRIIRALLRVSANTVFTIWHGLSNWYCTIWPKSRLEQLYGIHELSAACFLCIWLKRDFDDPDVHYYTREHGPWTRVARTGGIHGCGTCNFISYSTPAGIWSVPNGITQFPGTHTFLYRERRVAPSQSSTAVAHCSNYRLGLLLHISQTWTGDNVETSLYQLAACTGCRRQSWDRKSVV